MTIQIIDENREPSIGERFGQAFSNLGQSASQMIPQYLQGKQQQSQMAQANEYIKNLTGKDLSGIRDPEERKVIISELLKQQGKEGLFNRKMDFFGKKFGGKTDSKGSNLAGTRQPTQPPFALEEDITPNQSNVGQFNPLEITDEDIMEALAVDPVMGRGLQNIRDTALQQQREREKISQRKFEGERAYHSGFSKELEKEINQLRNVIPKKEMALNFSRNAVETGDVSYFSPDKLADATGIDLFRTAKGAQLITAGKENLLSNMGRVSAKAQNIWFEQRLNSMFPKIGQSREANLTIQEMLEGEVDLDKAYLNEFDKLSSEDEGKYGFVKKDISKRAREGVKSQEKEIMRRTSYRMKEIEENEKGLKSLKSEVGKNVTRGTPLTLAMAKLYKEKFGDNALKLAEKNGYYIPSVEEFRIFQQRPQERQF